MRSTTCTGSAPVYGMSATSVLVQLSELKTKNLGLRAGLLDHRSERSRRVRSERVRVGLDLVGDLSLPRDPDRARDLRPAVLEVVLEVEAEVQKCPVASDVAAVEERRVAQGDECRERLGRAERLERALDPRGDLGQ